MDEFEQELKRELRRVPPPERFADGVMERVARERHERAHKRRAWLAATLLFAVVSGGAGVLEKQHHDREQETARRSFELAMQVTGRTFSEVEERINQVGVKSSEVER